MSTDQVAAGAPVGLEEAPGDTLVAERAPDATGPAPGRRRPFRPDRDVDEWHGAYVPYDIVKEFVIALVVVAVLVVGLAVVFSSPDDHAVTLAQWSRADPVDFAQTALAELAGTSASATYGPPYNTNGTSQTLGPVSLEKWVGVHIPIDTADDFVLGPLSTLPDRPAVTAALSEYRSASAGQQAAWTTAYGKALTNATYVNGAVKVAPGDYGPVPVLVGALTGMARSGALDTGLISQDQFYGTDYTKPDLFLADGSYLANLGQARHLSGDQWGMMNETGNFPGQAWLWLYTLWYQVPPMNSSANGDVEVWGIMMALTAILLFLPFIPGLRAIPRWVPVYRIIWRRHYAELAASAEP